MSSTDVICATLFGWLFMRKYTLAAMNAGRQAQLQHSHSASARRTNISMRKRS